MDEFRGRTTNPLASPPGNGTRRAAPEPGGRRGRRREERGRRRLPVSAAYSGRRGETDRPHAPSETKGDDDNDTPSAPLLSPSTPSQAISTVQVAVVVGSSGRRRPRKVALSAKKYGRFKKRAPCPLSQKCVLGAACFYAVFVYTVFVYAIYIGVRDEAR
mgnify:CR=1 FL=1